jgi:hypothetical protein
MLGFKYQIMHVTEGFWIYITLKCIHERTVHQDRQHVKN